MNISYALTCGRLTSLYINTQEETLYKKQAIQKAFYRNMLKQLDFRESELFKILEHSENRIVLSRLKRILKENDGLSPLYGVEGDFVKGMQLESHEYHYSMRFQTARNILNQKFKLLTGTEITSRDLGRLLNYPSNNIRGLLIHRKCPELKLLQRIEALALNQKLFKQGAES